MKQGRGDHYEIRGGVELVMNVKMYSMAEVVHRLHHADHGPCINGLIPLTHVLLYTLNSYPSIQTNEINAF